jgi:hypothetical protein
MKLPFAKAIDDAVDKYQQLPNKFVDTRFVLLFQVIFCLITYAAIVTAQIKVVDSCVFPLPSSSFIK